MRRQQKLPLAGDVQGNPLVRASRSGIRPKGHISAPSGRPSESSAVGGGLVYLELSSRCASSPLAGHAAGVWRAVTDYLGRAGRKGPKRGGK